MGLPVLGPAIIGAGIAGGASAAMLETSYNRWRNRERAQSYQEISMPPPKEAMAASRTRTRRPRFAKRRFRRRKYARVQRSVQPYAVTRVLRSVCRSSQNLNAGTLTALTVLLNSAYDPTGIFGAGQPLGYDQYTALYQRVAVVGWKVIIEACTADNTNPVVIGFTPMVGASALSDFQHYKELPGTVSRIMTPDVDKLIFTAKGGVKKYFMPRSGRMLSDDTVTHGVGGNPSRLLYGHLFLQAMDGTADPGVVNLVVTIVQKVVFYVPEIPSRS